jgi:hypothetical protein
MAQQYTATQITLLENQGENIFASERPCIIDRSSIAITSGTAIYTVPNYIVEIRRIMYRGWKLFPMPHRDLRHSYLSGQQGSRPYWYIYNNIGQSQIRLFPVPQENLLQVSSQSDLWGNNIQSSVVIEYFRVPDVSIPLTIPIFMRRRLLKCYINKRAFQNEGKGTKLKLSQYWNMKFNNLKQVYTDLLDDLTNRPRNITANNQTMRPYGFLPPPPILPVDKYGIPVDDITG